MKKVIVFLADGCEEIEALTPVDYLRRAGIDVVCASLNSLSINGSHNISFKADVLLKDVDAADFDMVIIPGGMAGAQNLAKSAVVSSFITAMANRKCLIAAICAAPVVVLSPLGLLKNKTFTCYPEMEKDIPQYAGSAWQTLTAGSRHTKDRVVTDGKLVTARAAGCAEEFALQLITLLCDADKAVSVKNTICAR